MEKIKARQQNYAEEMGFRTKGPRYLQGPTVIGMKLVVQALEQVAGPMHARDIFDHIHKNGLGNDFRIPPARPAPSTMGSNGLLKPQSPDPSHPEHPVRSYRYMKNALLNALETHGRIRQIHLETPLDPANPPDPMRTHIKKERVHEWRWELIPPTNDKTPWEEQESIDMSRADRLWLENMKHLQGNQDSMESFARNIAGPRANEPNFARIPRGPSALALLKRSEPIRGDPAERTRTILGHTSPQEFEHGNRLAARWRELTTCGPNSSTRADMSYESRSPWKDPNHMRKREEHRAMFNVKPFMSNYNPELFKDGARPGFNKDEPEYRQSRQGKYDVPIALKDMRTREFGFNYGLPKQKRLLAAANARGFDQPEWADQPPRDISHLSRRRQRTRLEQTREMAREFNAEDKYERRHATETARRPAKSSVTSGGF